MIENFFLDDDHNYVPPKDAKCIVQTETDASGKLVSERWFSADTEPRHGDIYYMNDSHDIVDKDEATILVQIIRDSFGKIVTERWFDITKSS
mgnify:CR=1 FL=1